MFIITVLPISKSKLGEELVYFATTEVKVGAILSVPLRKRMIPALVTKIDLAEDKKSQIRNAPFEIRKIDKIKAVDFFPEYFIHGAKTISDLYACSSGAIIDALVPKSIIENSAKIAKPLASENSNQSKTKARILAVQGDDSDRISAWRSLVRQEFANKRSIVFYLPTIEESNQLFEALKKGIEEYIFVLNSDIPPKKLITCWNIISEIEHSVVIIATGSFATLPRKDIKTVIIERENARGWIMQKRPYIDLRQSIIELATLNSQTIYLADTILRIETLHNLENEKFEYGSPFKWRSISSASDLVIDMKTDKKSDATVEEKDQTPIIQRKSKFKVLSDKLVELIKQNIEENTHMFIFALRKGLSPLTACDDCGTIVMCDNCQSPVVLHQNPESGRNYFMCHRCGERSNADTNCKKCDSWRLTPLGIGIDRVQEEIKNLFDKIDIFKIDSESTKTNKEIKEKIQAFKDKPGSILLGTELAMQNFNDKVDHVAIVSLDSLFSLPDFRILEKINYNLVRLRYQAIRTILIQTRRPDQKIFDLGPKGNISDFYRMTIDERRILDYPPFSILIKITIEGKKDQIANTMADIAKFLEPHNVDIFPAFTSTVRGKSVIHGLIKIASHAWPDHDLISKLRTLPPEVTIKINPESLL